VKIANIGQAILAAVPAGARSQIEPFIPDIVAAVHRAFSLATASTFVFGIFGALLAALMVAFLREVPMRVTATEPSHPVTDSGGRGRTLAEPGE
jgi:hypothetical protein